MTVKRLVAIAFLLSALGLPASAPPSAFAITDVADTGHLATFGAARVFANCTALNKVYRHGVGRKGARDRVSGSSRPVTNFAVNTAVYNANKKSDRDKDGVACEKR